MGESERRETIALGHSRIRYKGVAVAVRARSTPFSIPRLLPGGTRLIDMGRRFAISLSAKPRFRGLRAFSSPLHPGRLQCETGGLLPCQRHSCRRPLRDGSETMQWLIWLGTLVNGTGFSAVFNHALQFTLADHRAAAHLCAPELPRA